MSPGPQHLGLCLPSDLVGFLGREHTGGTVMVSEAHMPLYPDLGDNGQWDVGVGIRNLDKGPAASPAADANPLSRPLQWTGLPQSALATSRAGIAEELILQRWPCSHGSPGVLADHTGDTSSLG